MALPEDRLRLPMQLQELATTMYEYIRNKKLPVSHAYPSRSGLFAYELALTKRSDIFEPPFYLVGGEPGAIFDVCEHVVHLEEIKSSTTAVVSSSLAQSAPSPFICRMSQLGNSKERPFAPEKFCLLNSEEVLRLAPRSGIFDLGFGHGDFSYATPAAIASASSA